jgi:hypothetical protein
MITVEDAAQSVVWERTVNRDIVLETLAIHHVLLVKHAVILAASTQLQTKTIVGAAAHHVN